MKKGRYVIGLIFALSFFWLLVSCGEDDGVSVTPTQFEDDSLSLSSSNSGEPAGQCGYKPNLNKLFYIRCINKPVKTGGKWSWEAEIWYKYNGSMGNPLNISGNLNEIRCKKFCNGFDYRIIKTVGGYTPQDSKDLPVMFPAGENMAFMIQVTNTGKKPAKIEWVSINNKGKKEINIDIFPRKHRECEPIPCSADLQADRISDTPSTAAPGDVIRAFFQYTNNGPDISNVKPDFYISSDPIFDSSDFLLDDSHPSFEAIGAGVMRYHSGIPINIPSNAPSGTFYLFVNVHSGEYYNCTDPNPENNYTTSPTLLRIISQQESADLSGDWITAPSSATVGTQISVGIQYTNHGPDTTGVMTYYYLSQDASYSSDDFLVDQYGPFGPVSANQTITHSSGVPVNIPSNAPNGTFYLVYVPRSSEGITDPNLSNDSAFTQITVLGSGGGCTADLMAAAIEGFPTEITPGITTSMSVYIMYRNYGPDTNNGVMTYYYLSRDIFYSEDDILLDTYGPFGPITSGQSIEHSGVPVNIPSSIPAGIYYMIFAVKNSGDPICSDPDPANNYVQAHLNPITVY